MTGSRTESLKLTELRHTSALQLIYIALRLHVHSRQVIYGTATSILQSQSSSSLSRSAHCPLSLRSSNWQEVHSPSMHNDFISAQTPSAPVSSSQDIRSTHPASSQSLSSPSHSSAGVRVTGQTGSPFTSAL